MKNECLGFIVFFGFVVRASSSARHGKFARFTPVPKVESRTPLQYLQPDPSALGARQELPLWDFAAVFKKLVFHTRHPLSTAQLQRVSKILPFAVFLPVAPAASAQRISSLNRGLHTHRCCSGVTDAGHPQIRHTVTRCDQRAESSKTQVESPPKRQTLSRRT